MQMGIGIIVTTLRTDESDHEGHAASAKSMNLYDNPISLAHPPAHSRYDGTRLFIR